MSWYQVGRPWLQLPERSVSSISRSSAFISVTVSARLARTAAWQAMVASSSFWRADEHLRSRRIRGCRASRLARQAGDVAAGEQRGRGAHRELVRARDAELQAEALERLAILLGGGDVERFGATAPRAPAGSGAATAPASRLVLQLLHDDALVRGVHVDQHQAGLVLRQDVDAVQLRRARSPSGGDFSVPGRASALRPPA